MSRTPSWALPLLLAALPLLGACNPLYLAQAVGGQAQLVSARRPVTEVLADPATAADTRSRLAAAREAVAFARQQLALPDNGSYRDYVELDRPYVVWNVFAAPAFSLSLRTWCFPVAGCVAYRGYFDEQDARRFAAGRAARGEDVYVGGAVAYSTLGYFRDPLLSSLLRLPDPTPAGLIFHELAHQQVYAPGDTIFNESFATLVEQEGMVRWLRARGDAAALCRFLDGQQRQQQVRALLQQARAALAAAYAAALTPDERAARKEAEFRRLRERYRTLRAGWPGPPYFDGWFDGPLNNARLGALAAYDQLVGTLRVILDGEGGDLPAFYRRAARLARLDAADRREVLAQITRPGGRGPVASCPGAGP